MHSEKTSAPGLDSIAWEDVQEIVRTFRQALDHGQRPALEAFLPETGANRSAALVELVHEEMEVRIKAGEPVQLESYLERFGELAADPSVVAELAATESEFRRRATAGALEDSGGGATSSTSRLGRYELRDVIGRGAFGIVYRAWDTALNRDVALKRPRVGVLDAPGSVERFLREACSAAALRHPHIVAVLDVGEVDGEPYLVSALVEGRNLAEELADRRPSFRKAAEWVASMAEALEHAHGSGVIHRDVKPSNILIDRDDRVYLADFGLAKSDAGMATLTIEGQVIGTPAYMAPEQARSDCGRADARSDIYSLGVVLYELLTGTRPFPGADQMVLVRIQVEDPHRPRRLDDTIPRDLETVCLKAMAKAPGHRYPNAAEFAADLRRFLNGESVQARPVGPIGAAWRICRRKPLVSGLAAALMLAILLGFAAVTSAWRRAYSQRNQALQALEAGIVNLRTALDLTLPDSVHPDVLQRRREELLDSARMSLLEQVRVYPELREPLASLTMAALSITNRTASVEDVLRSTEKTRSSFESLIRLDPTYLAGREYIATCLAAEGTLLAQLGRIEEEEVRLRQSLDQWEAFHTLAESHSQAYSGLQGAREASIATEMKLAEAEARLGRRSEAVSICRQALARSEELTRKQPGSEQARRWLAGVLWRRGAAVLRESAPSEAIAMYRRASELIEPIAREHPSEIGVQDELGNCLYWAATLEDRTDRTAEAIADFRRAIAIFEKRMRVRPHDLDIKWSLATSYHVLGRLMADTGNPAESLELYRNAIALREEISGDNPNPVRTHSDCGGSWYRLAEALEILGRLPEAVEAYQKSIVRQRHVFTREPGEIKHRAILDERLRHTSWLLLVLGHPAEATELVRERTALRPEDPAVPFNVAVQHVAAILIRLHDRNPFDLIGPECRRHVVTALGAANDAARLIARKAQLAKAK